MKITIFLLLMFSASLYASDSAPSLPVSPSSWLDHNPLKWDQLKGKVVMLNVWTFGCWNSYRSLPWVVSVQKKFPDLKIIGVHSPEFGYEQDRSRMRQVMSQYGAIYPQILDDDHDYWNKLSNNYWPAFYIVDKTGKIRGRFAGETHAGDQQAANIEKLIQDLTDEK